MARILVVDDDDGISAYLVDALSAAGYDVDRAATADGAVERVRLNAYDLVLMDLLLQGRSRVVDDPSTTPSPNGAITTLALRALGYGGPVVVITGNLAGIDEGIMDAAGFAGRLLKPALPSAVLPEVAKHLAAPWRKRVLLVEDDAALAGTVSKILEHAGYDVDVAATGETAAAMLTRRPYAMALIDINLPGVGGDVVAQGARDGGMTIPLVAVTGYGTETVRPAFDAVVEKPLSLSRILSIVDEYAPLAGRVQRGK